MGIYLTPELKTYYYKCLEEAIDANEIDNGLKEMLLAISKSPNIQPILSRRYQGYNEQNDWSVSNLYIAFAENIGLSLESALNDFAGEMKSKFIKVDFVHLPRMENSNLNVSSKACWKKDKDYFEIHFFVIDLENKELSKHTIFWDNLFTTLKAF